MAFDLYSIQLGLGTWQWGDRWIWGFGGAYAEADIRGAFNASLAAGVDFFDTAEMYGLGQSEKFLGAFARAAGRPVSIATKYMPLPWRLSKAAFRRALRGSLSRLGLERVDLYQIHHPLPIRSPETWMDAMADAADAGLIGAVGVSNYGVDWTRRAHAALQKRGLTLAANQVEYSLLNRGIERSGLLTLCRDLNVRVIAYSPIAMGLLSGKYSPDAPPPGARARMVGREGLTRSAPLVAALRQIGESHGGRTPAQVAINWCMCKGTLPIPGAKNAEQAAQNAGALGWRLSEDDVARLDEISGSAGGRT